MEQQSGYMSLLRFSDSQPHSRALLSADMADGARDHAVPFACLKDFTDVSAALDSMEQEAKGGRQLSVTVVGAGNAGVELSANIQHRLGKKAQVQIVASGDRVLPVRLPPAPCNTAVRQWLHAQQLHGAAGVRAVSARRLLCDHVQVSDARVFADLS